MNHNKSNRGAGREKESAIRRKRQRASSNDPIETVPEKSRLPYLARHARGALEGPIVSFSQFGPAFHLRGNLDLAQNGLFVFTVKVGSEDSVNKQPQALNHTGKTPESRKRQQNVYPRRVRMIEDNNHDAVPIIKSSRRSRYGEHLATFPRRLFQFGRSRRRIFRKRNLVCP